MFEHKHTCLFYHSKEELIEIAVPFLQSGLANHEFCLWIIPPELPKEEALAALGKTVDALEKYLNQGQLEISSPLDFYLKSGTFIAFEMIDHWDKTEKEVVACGFNGISVVGDAGWGADEHWINLLCYEQGIENVIDRKKIKALCTYRLDCFDIIKIQAIGHSHHNALVKGPKQWNSFTPKDFPYNN